MGQKGCHDTSRNWCSAGGVGAPLARRTQIVITTVAGDCQPRPLFVGSTMKTVIYHLFFFRRAITQGEFLKLVGKGLPVLIVLCSGQAFCFVRDILWPGEAFYYNPRLYGPIMVPLDIMLFLLFRHLLIIFGRHMRLEVREERIGKRLDEIREMQLNHRTGEAHLALVEIAQEIAQIKLVSAVFNEKLKNVLDLDVFARQS